MSVLNKVPFINLVLSSLSKDYLLTLASLMNGEGDRTELNRTLDTPSGNRTNISVSDKGVHMCSLQCGTVLFHGYLLYNDSYCVLIHFTDFQRLSMFDIDATNKQFETVSEYLDINELRSIVGDLLVEAGEDVTIQVDDIESGEEPAGKMIASDGEGGAEWVDVPVDANPENDGQEHDPLSLLNVKGRQYTVLTLEDTCNSDGIYFKFERNGNYVVDSTSNYASYIRILDKMVVFVSTFDITKTSSASDPITIGSFENIPTSIFNKLIAGNYLDEQNTRAFVDGTFTSVLANTALQKGTNNDVKLILQTENLVVDTKYHVRHISIFLLSDNHLIAKGCKITNLGASTPTNVVFAKSSDFPTEAQAWEEVTIGSDKFAKFTPWYKKPIYSGSELIGFEISDTKEDDSYQVYDCFLDENGNVLPYILIGRYCMSSTTEASSIDATRATMTISAARALAQAKGTGYQIMDASMQIFWRDLALAISQTVNFNNGSGVASYLGLARMTEGGWWIDGLTHVDTTYLYCNKPSKYVDQPTASSDGYNALSFSMPTNSGGCISKLGYDSNFPTINLPSDTVNNSSYNTYYCDGLYYASGNRPCGVAVGRAIAFNGLFSLDGSHDWTYAGGARLCYKPTIQ